MKTLRILGLAIPGLGWPDVNRHVGRYVVSFQIDHPDDPYAGLVTTDDPERAMQFPDVAAASEFWRQQSEAQPKRDTDGKPNRPLTMFTVEIN